MKLQLFNYHLPQSRIAQKPAVPRDSARLLTLDKTTGAINHKTISAFPSLLRKGDVLVVNNSKVIPARLLGTKPTGGHVEVFLLKKISASRWEAMIKSSGKKEGMTVLFKKNISGSVISRSDDKVFVVEFSISGNKLDTYIESYGETPTPPYIKRKASSTEYQTIYASEKKKGSVAAPTAGLHFTKPLLNKIKGMGVQIEEVTLHVGLGTFAPVETDNIKKHKIHSEYAEVDAKTFNRIKQAKKEGRRIIAVGTTSVRVLESIAAKKMRHTTLPLRGWVEIYIYPGYRFKVVDAMLTNFHLPKSTLLMLVSAFSGRTRILRAYREAVRLKYRFYSFGDAMFLY